MTTNSKIKELKIKNYQKKLEQRLSVLGNMRLVSRVEYQEYIKFYQSQLKNDDNLVHALDIESSSVSHRNNCFLEITKSVFNRSESVLIPLRFQDEGFLVLCKYEDFINHIIMKNGELILAEGISLYDLLMLNESMSSLVTCHNAEYRYEYLVFPKLKHKQIVTDILTNGDECGK